MEDKTPNGLLCLYCGEPLFGRKLKYCSDAHRMRYKRDRKRTNEQPTNEQPANNEQFAIDNSRAVIETRERLSFAMAKVESLTDERDQLTRKVDELTDRLIAVERENAVLGANRTEKGQEKDTIETANRRDWYSYALLIILVIVAAAVVYVALVG